MSLSKLKIFLCERCLRNWKDNPQIKKKDFQTICLRKNFYLQLYKELSIRNNNKKKENTQSSNRQKV